MDTHKDEDKTVCSGCEDEGKAGQCQSSDQRHDVIVPILGSKAETIRCYGVVMDVDKLLPLFHPLLFVNSRVIKFQSELAEPEVKHERDTDGIHKKT